MVLDRGKQIIIQDMKKYLLTISLFFLLGISCKKDQILGDESKNEYQILAEKYGYKLSHSLANSNTEKLSLVNLESQLQKIKEDNDSVKIKSIENSEFSNNEYLIRKKYVLDQFYKLSQPKKYVPLDKDLPIGGDGNGSGPDGPYKYSLTLYFNNTFPKPNYWVRIDYNTNGHGGFTGVNVSSGTWGYYIAGNYSQIGLSSFIQGGSLAFQASGNQGFSIASGAYTFSSVALVDFIGLMQLNIIDGMDHGTLSFGSVVETIRPVKSQN